MRSPGVRKLVEDYSEAKQPTQLFSSENNFLTHDL